MSVYCITGANRGLGLEFVRQLAQSPEKHTIIATVRPGADTKDLDAIASPQTHILECDTSSVPAIHLFANKLARFLDGEQKKINYLVNNAGLNDGPAGESSLSLDHTNFARQVTINVVGPAKVVEFLLDHKLLAPSVRIANITSSLASLALTTQNTEPLKHAGYSVSKTALNMLTVHQSRDIRSKAPYALPGAIVVALDPGWVKTRMGGEGAVLEPAESISDMLKTLHSLQDKDNGNYVRHDGARMPW